MLVMQVAVEDRSQILRQLDREVALLQVAVFSTAIVRLMPARSDSHLGCAGKGDGV